MARRISKPEKGKSRKMESDSDWWERMNEKYGEGWENWSEGDWFKWKKRMREKESHDRDDDWGEEVDWDEFDKKMEEAFGDWGEDVDWGDWGDDDDTHRQRPTPTTDDY